MYSKLSQILNSKKIHLKQWIFWRFNLLKRKVEDKYIYLTDMNVKNNVLSKRNKELNKENESLKKEVSLLTNRVIDGRKDNEENFITLSDFINFLAEHDVRQHALLNYGINQRMACCIRDYSDKKDEGNMFYINMMMMHKDMYSYGRQPVVERWCEPYLQINGMNVIIDNDFIEILRMVKNIPANFDNSFDSSKELSKLRNILHKHRWI